MQQNEKWEAACDAADFDGEEMMECRAGEREILLVRVGDRIVACRRSALTWKSGSPSALPMAMC